MDLVATGSRVVAASAHVGVMVGPRAACGGLLLGKRIPVRRKYLPIRTTRGTTVSHATWTVRHSGK